MGTLSRKQREIQQRELLFLDVARKMLIEHGYSGLTMEKVAEATEYSKGTIYQHFLTKEDLVTALAIQSLEDRAQLFGKAAGFVGRSRERFLAIMAADGLFGKLHPHHFRSELIIKMADLGGRASDERQEHLRRVEDCCLSDIKGIVRDAVDKGDLVLPAATKPSDVVYAVLTLAVGTQTTLLHFPTILRDLGIDDPVAASRENVQTLLDGFGWRPLRAEWDYDATFQRISREVFADEWQRAGLG